MGGESLTALRSCTPTEKCSPPASVPLQPAVKRSAVGVTPPLLRHVSDVAHGKKAKKVEHELEVQEFPEIMREPGLRKNILIIEAKGAGDKIVGDTRKDDHALWQALEEFGWDCEVVAYEADQQVELMKLAVQSADAVLPRVPSTMLSARQRQQFRALLQKIESVGVPLLVSPDALEKYGPAHACKINGTAAGLGDTAYYSGEAFFEKFQKEFPRSLAKGPRVIKCQSPKWDGTWRVSVLNEGGSVSKSTEVKCVSAKDHTVMLCTLSRFMGRYEDICESSPGLLDMQYLPKVVEGEYRVIISNRAPVEVYKSVPSEGDNFYSTKVSAGGLTRRVPLGEASDILEWLKLEMEEIHESLGGGENLPLVWIVSLVPKDEGYAITSLSCDCVGFNEYSTAKFIAREAVNIIMSNIHSHKRTIGLITQESTKEQDSQILLDNFSCLGWNCETVPYVAAMKNDIMTHLQETCDGCIHWTSPVVDRVLTDMLKKLEVAGLVTLTSEEAAAAYGAGSVLFKIKDVARVVPKDTYLYGNMNRLRKELPLSLASSSDGRTITFAQNAGGVEEIWFVKAAEDLEAESIPLDAKVTCMRHSDNQEKEQTLQGFLDSVGSHFERDCVAVSQPSYPAGQSKIRLLMSGDMPVALLKLDKNAVSQDIEGDWQPIFNFEEQLVQPFLADLHDIDEILGPFPSRPLLWSAYFSSVSSDRKGAYALTRMECGSADLLAHPLLALYTAQTARTVCLHKGIGN